MTGADEDSGEAELAALQAAFDERAGEIRDMSDHAEAVHAAERLLETSLRFRGLAAKLRTEMAERLRDAEGLSLAQLAARLGVGKPTAQQLLERDKRAARPPRVRRGVKRPQPPE